MQISRSCCLRIVHLLANCIGVHLGKNVNLEVEKGELVIRYQPSPDSNADEGYRVKKTLCPPLEKQGLQISMLFPTLNETFLPLEQ